jgi:hypothetical protein
MIVLLVGALACVVAQPLSPIEHTTLMSLYDTIGVAPSFANTTKLTTAPQAALTRNAFAFRRIPVVLARQ